MAARAAIDRIKAGDTVAIHGAGGGNVEPDLLVKTLAEKFAETASPGSSPSSTCPAWGLEGDGVEQLTGEGLVKRNIGGHYGMSPSTPSSFWTTRSSLLLAAGGHVPVAPRGGGGPAGLITHIGLRTFIDRGGGGKLNARTTEELIEWSRSRGGSGCSTGVSPQCLFHRGTTADEKGTSRWSTSRPSWKSCPWPWPPGTRAASSSRR